MLPEPSVVVVIPVRDAAATLDATLWSVLGQRGPFRLHVHVQDGGSTDGTWDLVGRYAHALAGAGLPGVAPGIVMTMDRSQDSGLYDAINRGVAAVGREADFITWINGDDLLAPGALATGVTVLGPRPDAGFVTGRAALLDRDGAVNRIFPLVPLSRRMVAAGLHDERYLGYVMQEGTLVRGTTWRAVGGPDARLRLAGDFDLWRRLAQQADFVTVDTILGFHRRRPGQLSQDKCAYHAEADSLVDGPTRDALMGQLLDSVGRPDRMAAEGLCARVVAPDSATGGWTERAHADYADLGPRFRRLAPADRVTVDGSVLAALVPMAMEGFLEPEGPYPQWNLHGPLRWLTGTPARVWFNWAPGTYTVALRARALEEGLNLVARLSGKTLGRWPLPCVGHARDLLIEIPVEVSETEDALELTVTDATGAPAASDLKLILLELLAYPAPLPRPS